MLPPCDFIQHNDAGPPSPRSGLVQPERSSEPEPADSVWDKFNTIAGWLRSLASSFDIEVKPEFANLYLELTAFRVHDSGVIAERIPELKRLTPEEKLILVGELWDELAADPSAFPVREDHIKLLQERLEHYRKHPEDVEAWEDLKRRILSSR